MRRLHPWMSSRYLATAAPCVRTAPAPGATIHSLPRVATPAAARWNQPVSGRVVPLGAARQLRRVRPKPAASTCGLW